MSPQSFSNCATGKNIFLAVAPAFLHFLERDVGRHSRSQRCEWRQRLFPHRPDRAAQSENRQQLVEHRSTSSSSCNRRAEIRLPRAAWPGLREAARVPLTRARPPPRSSMRRVMTSKVRHAPCANVQAEQRRIDVRAERVDVVQQQVLQDSAAPSAVARARRCAGGSEFRTSGRRDAGIARARCRCNRCLRLPACAQPISAACRLSRTFCACSSSSCCGISSQGNRRSRSIGIMRRPMARAGRKQQRPA